ncbi:MULTISPECIES: biliverdin-producing heme oxygenase [unclassified Pseudomonas]|uniref:biliverdin-producing heme oxygenase n=1 Tax=unclassified Pseudomonas TaxID=196821 RepID=UPI002B2222C3|nr:MULTISPECIES: biliverdin-producing heme oxygenase [unclassified Pseudomonas]MEA9975917.1 biliverdin-producing heme oxygenase [Pseudomonas sp. RTS4]MEB0196270.1 biliverdin-producing heme oxygenase [Pseudomonas sp. 5S4]MEB0245321.1 biliverdin-producing heme oxygenase [Pseudomonas sp. 10S5]
MKKQQPSVPPVHSDLRAATSHLHRRLDARLPFFTTDIAVYRRIMQAYYGFYLPFETLLAASASTIPGMGWAQRLKTPILKQDLLALGLTFGEIDALPLCKILPGVETQAQALGALYVVEGATLGGQVLRGIIKAKVGVESATGGAFMDVYGAETRNLWQGFLTCLSCIQEPEDIAQTVATAQQTFICFEGWLEQSDVLQ